MLFRMHTQKKWNPLFAMISKKNEFKEEEKTTLFKFASEIKQDTGAAPHIAEKAARGVYIIS